MAKVAIVLAIVLVSLLALTVLAIYYFSTNQAHQKEQGIPTATPTPTVSQEPTTSPMPTASPVPTPSPTLKSYSTPDITVVITPWYWNRSQYPTNSSVVIITSPENGKTYNTSSVTVSVNIGTTSPSFIHSVSYTGDWPGSGNNLFFHLGNYGGKLYLFPTGMTITLQPKEIPDGNHTITVYAVILTDQKNERDQNIAYTFTDTVNFTINTQPLD